MTNICENGWNWLSLGEVGQEPWLPGHPPGLPATPRPPGLLCGRPASPKVGRPGHRLPGLSWVARSQTLARHISNCAATHSRTKPTQRQGGSHVCNTLMSRWCHFIDPALGLVKSAILGNPIKWLRKNHTLHPMDCRGHNSFNRQPTPEVIMRCPRRRGGGSEGRPVPVEAARPYLTASEISYLAARPSNHLTCPHRPCSSYKRTPGAHL